VETLLVAALVLVALVVVAATVVAVALFAWVRHLWREFRRTRTFSQVARGAALVRPLVTYRGLLRQAPPGTADLTFRLQRKALTLESIEDQLGPEQRFRVEETTRRYLPDTMNAYPVAMLSKDTGRRREASRMLVEQLTVLEANLDTIASGAGENAIAALEANGLFLHQVSSKLGNG
jgi:hypothetical protein